MNELFRNTLGPAAWTAIALVPPAIFALYFLRLRREPLEVPSTYLWTKVIEDLHVNSLWQKLRRNLLLLLQLLLVGLAILALLRPGWQGEALDGRRFIFLVDRSASMSTTDAADRNAPGAGPSRLDAAKARVADLVNQLDSSMSAMIIAFDERADVIQEFTSNRRELLEALKRIEPSAAPTNIRSALDLAAGFAQPPSAAEPKTDDAKQGAVATDPAQSGATLYILSDGRFGAVETFAGGALKLKYLPLGKDATGNLAITAFNARRNELRPEQRQAFVQVTNFSDDKQEGTVSLFVDGRLRDAAELTIPAGDAAGATFNLGDVTAAMLEARLDPPAEPGDGLALDNRAYAVLDRPRNARVLLITPGNRALELALSTERVRRIGAVETLAPGALTNPAVLEQLQSELYDLVIFDQCAPEKPEQMPLANTLFIGRLPPLPPWQRAGASPPPANPSTPPADAPDGGAPSDASTTTAPPPRRPVGAPQIIDWQRGHPLLALVEFGNVIVAESLVVPPPPGGVVLVDSSAGPIASIAPRGSYEDAVLGFEIVAQDGTGAAVANTNWPTRLSFPNFCLNVVQYLAGGAAEAADQAHAPGKSVEIDLARPAKRLTVALPDKSTRSVAAPATGKLAFNDTDQLGIYQVLDPDAPPEQQIVARFAVNLFDRDESDVRIRTRQDAADAVETVQALAIGYEDVVAESASPARKELWTALLLAALAVLVLEWYIYNRRVYV